MHLGSGSSLAESHLRPSGPVSVTSLRNKIKALDPTLEQSSPTFRCAVLLLAAQHLTQNIDRLARITAYPREFVAKCARRLCDNGVWRQGATVCTWNEATLADGPDHMAFWADVAVAEGKMSRRVNGNGGIEWAQAGCWIKSYEDDGGRRDPSASTQYLSPDLQQVGASIQTGALLDEHVSAPEARVAQNRIQPGSRADTSRGSATGGLSPQSITRSRIQPQGESAPRHPEPTPPPTLCPELFAGTVWLT
jgi:hypothetical protein